MSRRLWPQTCWTLPSLTSCQLWIKETVFLFNFPRGFCCFPKDAELLLMSPLPLSSRASWWCFILVFPFEGLFSVSQGRWRQRLSHTGRCRRVSRVPPGGQALDLQVHLLTSPPREAWWRFFRSNSCKIKKKKSGEQWATELFHFLSMKHRPWLN